MPVPDYQKFMKPLLSIASDKSDHSMKDAIEKIASDFKLTKDDRKELLPSGKQFKFDNRVGWAKTFLKKAGLLESPQRGIFKITNKGLEVLKNNSNEINSEFLQQFPEFQEFYSRTSSKRESINSESNYKVSESNQTPEEIIEEEFEGLNNMLTRDLLEKIKSSSPGFFEKLVVDLLVAMGYGGSRQDAAHVVGKSGDGGIDGIIKEDKLGLDVIYVQAKRWENTVGRPIVQAFAGSLEGMRARKGVLITTSNFSQDAKSYVQVIDKKIILIDGEKLSELMIENNVGVTRSETYTVKRLDLDYFEE